MPRPNAVSTLQLLSYGRQELRHHAEWQFNGIAREPAPDLLQGTTDCTNRNIQLLSVVFSPLTSVKDSLIIPSETKVLLSLGLFSCGIQVRCSAAVNHPSDDSKNLRLDAERP